MILTRLTEKASTWLKIFIFLQLTAILLVASINLFKFPIWCPIDEEAHFSYIQYLAQMHRLPVEGQDHETSEAIAIAEKIYPHKPSGDPAKLGIGGSAYEAFQPPLYYLAATPFFYLSSNYITKVYWIRFFDFLLLFGSIFLLWRLARSYFRKPLPAFSLALNFFFLPGILLRSITISNEVLEVPLVLLFILFLFKFDRIRKRIYLLLASLTLAAAVLTKITELYLAPLILLAIARAYAADREKKQLMINSFSFLLIFLLPLAPWLLFNIRHFDSLTASNLAMAIQTPIINPQHLHFSVAAAGKMLLQSPTFLLIPEEWVSVAYDHFPVILTRDFIYAMFLILPVFLTLVSLRRAWKDYLLALPLLLNILVLAAIVLFEDWPVLIQARYMYPTLILWALYGYNLLRRQIGQRAIYFLSAVTFFLLAWNWIILFLLDPFRY